MFQLSFDRYFLHSDQCGFETIHNSEMLTTAQMSHKLGSENSNKRLKNLSNTHQVALPYNFHEKLIILNRSATWRAVEEFQCHTFGFLVPNFFYQFFFSAFLDMNFYIPLDKRELYFVTHLSCTLYEIRP